MPTVSSFPITTKTVAKADVGLGNVDNTADADKPVSTLQAAAISSAVGASVQNNLNASTTIAPSASAVQAAIDAKVQNSLTASTTVAPSATAVSGAISTLTSGLASAVKTINGIAPDVNGNVVLFPVVPMSIPHAGTALAARASQPTYGNLIDQGPNLNTPTNIGLVPVAWLASATVAANAYRTPTTLNGLVYKATAGGGGANGSTEPTWPTTIGGTVVSGAITYTAEKGPYFIDTDGVKSFRSLSSTQLGAQGVFQLASNATSAAWNLAAGQSLIIHQRIKFNWTASGQGNALPILSNKTLAGTNRGVRILATGAAIQNFRLQIRDSNGVSILSGDFNESFGQKVFDGNVRDLTIMICGVLKMAFAFVGETAITQANMFDGSTLCPNNMNLATLTGSTAGDAWTLGGDPGAAISNECAWRDVDIHVINGGLPANIQNIASWYARGGSGVLPQALVS